MAHPNVLPQHGAPLMVPAYMPYCHASAVEPALICLSITYNGFYTGQDAQTQCRSAQLQLITDTFLSMQPADTWFWPGLLSISQESSIESSAHHRVGYAAGSGWTAYRDLTAEAVLEGDGPYSPLHLQMLCSLPQPCSQAGPRVESLRTHCTPVTHWNSTTWNLWPPPSCRSINDRRAYLVQQLHAGRDTSPFRYHTNTFSRTETAQSQGTR